MVTVKRRVQSQITNSPQSQSTNDQHYSNDSTIRRRTLTFWMQYFTFVLLIFVITCNVSSKCWSCGSQTCGDFDVVSARAHLKWVTSLGPRTAGSVSNEIAASEYLRKELKSIAHLANHSGLHAFVDEQISNYSSFRTKFFVSTYNSVRNLIMRIHDPRNKIVTSGRKAFLVNCHFDSAIGSPGASDAFVSCAVMLEVLHSLARANSSLHNDIIFLFNGAEESILLASHAFVTQHPWASDVTAFLNLEGAGVGQRLLMFQVGPGNASQVLMDAYSNSFIQPYATVFAEDLFQSGKVPSDTDFRIFRDYGLIPGIDLAYVHDGYAYHTKHDIESRIDDDCLHQSGINLLKFVQLIALDHRIQHIPKLSPKDRLSQNSTVYDPSTSLGEIIPLVANHPSTRLVYFDFLGYSFFAMPWWLFKYLSFFIVLVYYLMALIDRRYDLPRWYCLLFCIALQMLTVLIGYVFSFGIGFILHAYGCRMTWYSNRYNLVGTFVLPILWWFIYAHTYLFRIPDGLLIRLSRLNRVCAQNMWSSSRSINHKELECDFFDAGVMLLTMVVLILMFFDKPTSYLAALWVFSATVAKGFLTYNVPFLSKRFCEAAGLTCVCSILVYHAYICNLLMEFVVPIMGRAGHKLKPDILIGSCVYAVMIPIVMLSAGWLQVTTKESAKTLRLFTLNACLSYALLIHITPYGFPYTVQTSSNISDPLISPRYQRVAVFHTNRFLRYVPNSPIVSEVDSHVLLVPLDVNGIRYLTPNSFPSSAPASFIPLNTYESTEYGGIEELINSTSYTCNEILPYCGLATPYPFLHMFKEFYHIKISQHSMEPKVNLSLVSRSTAQLVNERLGWNFTFSVTAGPPHTHVAIRLDDNYVKMHSWSFGSTAKEPVPVPIPSTHTNYTNLKHKHYFIFHLNAAAIGHRGALWETPWIFWFVLEPDANSLSTSDFDIAVTGIYIDEIVQRDVRSPDFENFVTRLPPWVSLLKGYAVYDHWRYNVTF